MAHDVSFTVPERELGKAAVEFKVRHNGVVIGRLRVSKGAIEWIGRDKEIGHKLAWREFASLVQGAQETDFMKRARKLDRQHSPRSQALKRGLKTPQRAYRPHILQILQDLGGSSEAERVRSELAKRMTFNAYDAQPVSSKHPSELRWWNTAKWERALMVKEGLLAEDSQWGIWQITDAGRKAAATTT